jgi:multimeric flavodoxin WrbA
MNITILNGNPFPERKEFDSYLETVLSGVRTAGHEARQFVLRDMKIRPCTGCFNCWVKTPGTCSIKDDSRDLAKNYIHADHVIFASPLIMGFFSSILKNALDRSIPLIHPHVEEVGGEAHHKKRYDRYPAISFLLEKEPFTDDEDIEIVTDIFRREAINVRSSLGFVKFTESPAGEVIHALDIH